jgi:hypothetical protein
MAEQVELGRGQIDALAVARDPTPLEVDDEVAAPQGAPGLRVGELPVGAAQERLTRLASSRTLNGFTR